MHASRGEFNLYIKYGLMNYVACIVSEIQVPIAHRTCCIGYMFDLNQIVLELGKTVKQAVEKQGMLAWQYNTIGVSDAVTMGGEGR